MTLPVEVTIETPGNLVKCKMGNDIKQRSSAGFEPRTIQFMVNDVNPEV